jgi:two-component system chemotaxis response regulator CheY
VGARLARDHRLHESLRVRGLGVYGVPSMADAIDSFRQRSYEVVLVEAHLDRADGIELIPTLRTLPGILELPVAVLDDRSRESRKASAKRAGATAYLGGEPDPGRLGQVLMRLFTGYRRRRFRRYELALAATVPGRRESALTGNVGRRGAFVRTAPEAPDGTYAFHVPELGRLVRVHADVVDRRDDPRSGASGICLHFRAFEAGDEPLWIDYLTRLESTGRERL